jgi:hypothetical protein
MGDCSCLVTGGVSFWPQGDTRGRAGSTNYWAETLSFDVHALAGEDARPEQRQEVPFERPT